MIRQSLTIKNQLGLHTRAAAKLVDLAKRYASKIDLDFRGRTVDCKSIMGVITLGAKKDDAVEFILNGEDEEAALVEVIKLLDNKFGED